jgi:hypothetical protein
MTHADRWRIGLLAALAHLAACSSAPVAPPPIASFSPPAPTANAASGCRVGPDGGPILADRGIGGTGIQPVLTADRGIGGTGIERASASPSGSRTGIVGVITGFASICLGGQEVAFDASVPVSENGRAIAAADLRAGHIAVVEASGPEAGLRASRVMIRYEVSGPVEAIDPDGRLRVAGQGVAVAASTLGSPSPGLGDWVTVSGLRGPDDEILATRIDRRPRGEAVVHGALVWTGAAWRIGTLEVQPAGGLHPLPGHPVTAAGRYADGMLYADTIEPDEFILDPLVYFGPEVGVVVVESFAGLSNGRLVLDRRRNSRGFGLGMEGGSPGRSQVEFERRPDGTLQPVSVRQTPGRPFSGQGDARTAAAGDRFGPGRGQDRGAIQSAHALEPAPVPTHALDRAMDRQGYGPSGNGPIRQGGGPRQAGGRGDRDATQDGSGFAPSYQGAAPYPGAAGAQPMTPRMR